MSEQHFFGPSWNPAIRDLLNHLKNLQDVADYRARLITNNFYAHETEEEQTLRQAKAQAAADTYAYCISCIIDLNRKI